MRTKTGVAITALYWRIPTPFIIFYTGSFVMLKLFIIQKIKIMNTKTTKILYRVFTLLLAAMFIMDAIGGITKQQAGVDVMQHLGYPVYFMQIMGVAKLLGVIAMVQTKFNTIREWAYAGFAFTFIGAFASRAVAGDTGMLLVLPVIMLAFLFVPYLLWKKLQSAKTVAGTLIARAYA